MLATLTPSTVSTLVLLLLLLFKLLVLVAINAGVFPIGRLCAEHQL